MKKEEKFLLSLAIGIGISLVIVVAGLLINYDATWRHNQMLYDQTANAENGSEISTNASARVKTQIRLNSTRNTISETNYPLVELYVLFVLASLVTAVIYLIISIDLKTFKQYALEHLKAILVIVVMLIVIGAVTSLLGGILLKLSAVTIALNCAYSFMSYKLFIMAIEIWLVVLIFNLIRNNKQIEIIKKNDVEKASKKEKIA